MNDSDNWTVIYYESAATSGWPQWLPLISAVIVAIVTIYVMVTNNAKADERNQATLDAARDNNKDSNLAAESREYVKWRRDKLSALAEELLEITDMSASRLRGSIAWELGSTKREFAEINNSISLIPHLTRRLKLVVGDSLDAICTNLTRTSFQCFMVATKNQRAAYIELKEARTETPARAAIDAAAQEVNTAQRAFITQVRAYLAEMPTPLSEVGTEPRSTVQEPESEPEPAPEPPGSAEPPPATDV